jgi:hypothetical protein
MRIAGERPEPAVQRSGQPYVLAVNGHPPPQRRCQSPPNQREAAMQLPLRQGKSRKGGRECDLKPFVAIQRVQLPPGKGERASQPEASFAWVVATSLLKRRQQVPKPRYRAPKFINR